MWSKLTDMVKRKGSTPASASSGSAASSSAAAAAPVAGKIGPTGVPLPPSSRPLVSYLGSPYGVAPDFVTNYPAGIGAGIDINDLHNHIAKLSAPVGEMYGVVQFDGFDIEFKHLEHLESLRPADSFDYIAANKEVNIAKNRYGNILPPEHTRVRLAIQDAVPDSDFVNANFVDGLCSRHRYIATQGPLPTTFDDFWRLVWEQDISVILMLTREIESGVIKCARYWPEPDDGTDNNDSNSAVNAAIAANGSTTKMDQDDDDDNNGASNKAKQSSSSNLLSDLAYVTFDGLPDVKPLGDGEEDAFQCSYGDVRVLFRGKRQGDEFVVRLFDLRRDGVLRRLTLLQYTGWPDHGVPASPAGFVTLSRLADLANKANTRANAKLARKRELPKPLPPLLTHCSAGVGRTGTFITVHSLLERVKSSPNEPLSVHKTLYDIRSARPNSVQTKEQYRFCYVSLAEQIRNLQAGIVAQEEAKAAKRAAYRAKKKQRLESDGAGDEPRSGSSSARNGRSHEGRSHVSPRQHSTPRRSRHHRSSRRSRN